MNTEKLSKIISVAQGKEKADLVIKNCKVVDPISQTITEGDIAIWGGYIVGVGCYEGVESIDAHGLYATSGLIDSHVHIESSLCTPEAFAQMVVPLGTTTVIADPHEIANVKGIDGIQFMISSSRRVPLKCHFMAPSCVPATDFEDSGAVLSSREIEEIIKEPRIIGLGEMMNSVGLLNNDKDILEKLSLTINEDKLIDGHGPMLSGKQLNGYRASGVKTDHECSTVSELKERLSSGMYVLLRQGSAAQNLETLIAGLDEAPSRRCAMCTDDKHPGDIIKHGHINHNLKIAVDKGFNVFSAIAMATINAAECYNLKNTGLIAPGFLADIVLFNDLKNFEARYVFINGKLVAKDNNALFNVANRFDRAVTHSVNIAPVSLEDLKIKIKGNTANVIGLTKHDLFTQAVVREVCKDSSGNFEYGNGLVKLVVVERHKASGKIGKAIMENYCIKGGAVATTIGHDSHNLIVAGDNDNDILIAIKELESVGGGITIVKNGKVIDTLVLKIAGIMSDKSAHEVSKKMDELEHIAFDELKINRDIDPFMTLSFLTLPVIPDIKLTPRGLFDVKKFEFIEVSA